MERRQIKKTNGKQMEDKLYDKNEDKSRKIQQEMEDIYSLSVKMK